METLKRYSLLKKIFAIKSIIIILSCIGSSLVIISTLNYGIGLEPDSASYIAAARNLLLGNGFVSFDAQPLTFFPPFYPILLALFSYIFGLDALFSAVLLNALLFGIIIYKSGMLLTKYLNSKSIIIIGVLAILLSEPIFSNSLWALSDLLFILLIIWYINYLVSYIEKKNLLSFIIIVIITALAALTRYIGITFLITTIITILIYSKDNIRKKIASMFVYSVLSVIPISVWLIRNYIISETFAGDRGTSRFSFLTNIYRTIKVILNWCLPGYFGEHKMFFVIILLTIVLFGALLFRKIKYHALHLKFETPISLILILFITVYLFLLILAETFKAQSAIDSRLLSPIYIPIIFFSFIILQAYYNSISSFRHYKLLRMAFFFFLIFGITNMCLSTFSIIKNHFNEGVGYSGSLWKNYYGVDLLKMISKNSIKDSFIYSNDPYSIYFFANEPANLSPMKTYEHSDEIYGNLLDLDGIWPSEKEAYLVWFRHKGDVGGWLYKPEELASISEMNITDSSNLYSIYFVKVKKKQ